MDIKFVFDVTSLNELKEFEVKLENSFQLYSVSSINNPSNNTILFVNTISEDIINKIAKLNECLIIINNNYSDIFIPESKNIIIYSSRPRKVYARILKFMLDKQIINMNYSMQHNGYYIGENVEIGKGTIIEPFVFIDHNVKIGSNCVIKSGARIRQYSEIGNECVIKENAVIGSEGFGVERDDDRTTYKIPHLGGVKIGDNVQVGALTSIDAGTIEPTIIEDHVKIDDCVFIAHNCKIGKGTFVIANAEVSGSVNIGEGSWIAPNACIINKVNIGNDATIGIGAVVTKDVSDNTTVLGNPADTIEIFSELRKMYKRMLKQ